MKIIILIKTTHLWLYQAIQLIYIKLGGFGHHNSCITGLTVLEQDPRSQHNGPAM